MFAKIMEEPWEAAWERRRRYLAKSRGEGEYVGGSRCIAYARSTWSVIPLHIGNYASILNLRHVYDFEG